MVALFGNNTEKAQTGVFGLLFFQVRQFRSKLPKNLENRKIEDNNENTKKSKMAKPRKFIALPRKTITVPNFAFQLS